MSAANNTKARSDEIAAATARIAATSYNDYYVIRTIMQETGCARLTARRHLIYFKHPELRPVNGGANRGQGRKPGSQNKTNAKKKLEYRSVEDERYSREL